MEEWIQTGKVIFRPCKWIKAIKTEHLWQFFYLSGKSCSYMCRFPQQYPFFYRHQFHNVASMEPCAGVPIGLCTLIWKSGAATAKSHCTRCGLWGETPTVEIWITSFLLRRKDCLWWQAFFSVSTCYFHVLITGIPGMWVVPLFQWSCLFSKILLNLNIHKTIHLHQLGAKQGFKGKKQILKSVKMFFLFLLSSCRFQGIHRFCLNLDRRVHCGRIALW